MIEIIEPIVQAVAIIAIVVAVFTLGPWALIAASALGHRPGVDQCRL